MWDDKTESSIINKFVKLLLSFIVKYLLFLLGILSGITLFDDNNV